MKLTAVVFLEAGYWISQILEYNLVGCASTLEEVPHELMRQVEAQIEGDREHGEEPLFGFRPAPSGYADAILGRTPDSTLAGPLAEIEFFVFEEPPVKIPSMREILIRLLGEDGAEEFLRNRRVDQECAP